MTLLTICQNAADEVKTSRPSSVYSSVDPDAQLLLRCAQKVGYTLMKRCPWQALRAEQTFTSLATEEQTAILPDDFDRFIPETFWDRSTPCLISGPIPAVRWQSLKATSYTGKPLFAHRGGAVYVYPVLSAGLSLAFEYVSKNWCQTSGATAQAAWGADTDTALLDEELMTLGVAYEYLLANGLPQAGQALQAYTDRYNILVGNDQPDGGVMVSADVFAGTSRHYTGEPMVMSLGY